MAIKGEVKLTSVKIVNDLYNSFKHISLDDDINLQKLVNRCVVLYINDKDFRNKINNFNELKESGSSF
tara:strand:+ start:279 stop:482 length:204 start_codon:yes stop_codon:yes gene_type:complete